MSTCNVEVAEIIVIIMCSSWNRSILVEELHAFCDCKLNDFDFVNDKDFIVKLKVRKWKFKKQACVTVSDSDSHSVHGHGAGRAAVVIPVLVVDTSRIH